MIDDKYREKADEQAIAMTFELFSYGTETPLYHSHRYDPTDYMNYKYG